MFPDQRLSTLSRTVARSWFVCGNRPRSHPLSRRLGNDTGIVNRRPHRASLFIRNVGARRQLTNSRGSIDRADQVVWSGDREHDCCSFRQSGARPFLLVPSVGARNTQAMTRPSTIRRLLAAVAVILIVVIYIVVVRAPDPLPDPPLPSDRFRVVSILDGDSAELRGGDQLRLLGIDTPEAGQPFADDASSLFRRLTADRPLRLTYNQNRRDRYGRLLAFAYVDDTLMVNRVLVDSGLAWLYLHHDQDNTTSEFQQLLAAQQHAIDHRVGVWAEDHPPESHYLSSPNSFRFHRPKCRHLDGLAIDRWDQFPTRSAAMRTGLSPCRTCQP